MLEEALNECIQTPADPGMDISAKTVTGDHNLEYDSSRQGTEEAY